MKNESRKVRKAIRVCTKPKCTMYKEDERGWKKATIKDVFDLLFSLNKGEVWEVSHTNCPDHEK